jgi:hypothetical protein
MYKIQKATQKMYYLSFLILFEYSKVFMWNILLEYEKERVYLSIF